MIRANNRFPSTTAVTSKFDRLNLKMGTFGRIIIVASFILSCSAVCYSHAPTAREVVNAMVARYKSISTYQDAGEVNVTEALPTVALLQNVSFQQPPSAGETLVSFRTYFRRPNIFRFDWKGKESERESSIWFDGSRAYQWWPDMIAREKRFTLYSSKYLDISLDEAAGKSSGAVFPIISMLVAKASVISFDDLLRTASRMTLTKDEDIEGDMCYVINTDLSGSSWTLWIDKRHHLLRKTRTVYSYGSFHERVEKGIRREFVAEERRRDIKINEPISKDVFRYRPALREGDVDLTR
jgi:hypothetical protein